MQFTWGFMREASIAKARMPRPRHRHGGKLSSCHVDRESLAQVHPPAVCSCGVRSKQERGTETRLAVDRGLADRVAGAVRGVDRSDILGLQARRDANVDVTGYSLRLLAAGSAFRAI